ncbi:MAG TPA: crosslink repair DNA glycosylase YcaQ family protein [Anaerolineales bacterium]|nr:crosslink repair DNA glycosylase YcaQ family protein [Anaerolineales bacterium]
MGYNGRVTMLDLKRFAVHRGRTYHLPPLKPLSSPSQALRFVNERGFVFFWPIKGVDFPSLWTAVAGDRPVPDEHDDPGHVTWRWKDDALPRRIWYYAKILRRKATMISLEVIPYFYALSENYGSPEEDHLVAYEDGRLTLAAKNIYDVLLKEGALDSISLRKAARLTSAKESEWNRALEDLQKDLKILPVGVAEVGAWKYAFVYQLTARHYPDLVERAGAIGESQARTKLLELYFESVGAAQARDANKIFGWGTDLTWRALTRLVESGKIRAGGHPQQKGEWMMLAKLCEDRN